MIVLDTNVVSEVMLPNPSPAVVRYLASYSRGDIYTTAITEAEIRYGVAILPQGRKRSTLQRQADLMFKVDFAGRILVFDSRAAEAYAAIVAARRTAGRPIAAFDAQIAAIVQSHSAVLITRNVRDFEHCGLHLINPWTDW